MIPGLRDRCSVLFVPEARVQAPCLQKRPVVSALDDRALVEDKDFVGLARRR